MSLDPRRALELLAAVAHAQTRDGTGELAAELLNFLLRQLEELRDLANGYPRNPISGAVWFNGRALAELCDELTTALEARGLPEQAELASRLATGMALQVMGHYPEEIFPRVLRNSLCREAVGQFEEAIGGYEAIVDDFDKMGLGELLDREALDGEPLDSSERTILECVRDAALRLVELRPERGETANDLTSAIAKALEDDTG